MSIRKDIRSVTYLKSRAADLLEQINRERRPVVITQNGEPKAVMMDPDSYDRMRAAVGLMKLIAQGEEAARTKHAEEQEELFDRLTRKYEVTGSKHGRRKKEV